jgi:hypothetical protein
MAFVKRWSLLVGSIGVVIVSAGDRLAGQAGAFTCGMQMNQTPVVFCDTFDQPSPITNRSGQLNGTVWGVSRVLGGGTVEGGWKDSILDGCAGPQAASGVNATDVIICNGQLRESVDDNTDVSVLAMYPKQPFDFANRVGTVAFDVTNDTTGGHGAWPEFWITDQPVPAPFSHLVPCDTCTEPRNGFGIRFAADRGSCGNGWRADSAVVVRNYVAEDKGIFDTSTNGMYIRELGCATLSSGPNGGLNHVELRISQNQIDIYASDAGSQTLKLINTVYNANLSLTRGLIWLEDAHYNAEKACTQDPSVPCQKNHTFTWDNVAFDGPPTYRDLSYDVLNNNNPLGNGVYQIGWWSTPLNPANLNTLPTTAQNIAAATGAYLLFNFGKDIPNPTVFNYTINGFVNSAPDPLPAGLIGNRSLAVPVPLNQLVPGAQNIRLSSDQTMLVENVNIVLVAAATVPPVAGAGPTAPANLRISSP